VCSSRLVVSEVVGAFKDSRNAWVREKGVEGKGGNGRKRNRKTPLEDGPGSFFHERQRRGSKWPDEGDGDDLLHLEGEK